ncbi:MAG: GNAT family N-acetyltransferase [Chitinophagaceae bacterium]|jgi:GNAT superfamily N-acetyltransferase|nr:MAG: GNAT family N-acetyltransferase [Chitinophagaceae bacterium]
MKISHFDFVRLGQSHLTGNFDCDDTDLNDFLKNTSFKQQEQLLGVTYLLKDEERVAAFFTLSNDKIRLEDGKSKNFWNSQVSKGIPHNKRRKDYPAVKLGRLGVHNECKSRGIGTMILDYLKTWFRADNRAGCRFLTVDAYVQSLEFYLKNGFNYLNIESEREGTRLLYFDLGAARK